MSDRDGSDASPSSTACSPAALLERHLANAPLAVIEWDNHFRLQRWSGQAQRLFGWSESELKGKHPDDWPFIAEADRADTKRVLQGLVDGSVPNSIHRNRNLTRDGRTLYCEWYNSALFDADGRLQSILTLVQDITEQTETHARLQLASTIVQNTSDGVMVTDARGNILAINPAFTRVTGYTEDEALGQNPRLLQSGVHDQRFYANMWGALNRFGHWQGEIWNRRKSGEIYPQWINTNAVKDAQGDVSRYVCVFSDLTDIKQSEAELERLAHRDPVTHLPNRLLFRSRLEQALTQQMSGHHGPGPCVLHLDLNNFRAINDSLGYQTGDRVLHAVGLRLQAVALPSETLACFGGDEFALLVNDQERASMAAETVLRAFETPLQVDQDEIYLRVSIGIASAPVPGNQVETLLQHAQVAANRAKTIGGNLYRFYAEELTEAARRRLLLINGLHQALDNDQFELRYQPQIDLRTGQPCGCEALLRWHHPDAGLIAPDEFIALAEETGLIVPLGEWVIQTACAQQAQWLRQGLSPGPIAINISVVQLQRGDLIAVLAAALQRHGLSADTLELEVTESALMDQSARPTFHRLHQLGVSLALDDFGTGYSSLAYLQRLQFDIIKVDRTFVQNVPQSPRDTALLEAIVELSHGLGSQVLAEGVETQAQQAFLQELECERAQGYLFSRPLPAAELTPFLQRHVRSAVQRRGA